MHRFLRHGLWLGLLLAAGGCDEETAGTGPGSTLPDGVLVETIIRIVTPDHPFYTVPFPAEPTVDTAEQGTWMEETGGDDYRDVTRFGLVGSAFFVSPETGAQVPTLVQIGTTSAGASVRVVVDQVRGTLGVFGLKDFSVQVEVDVYQLRG